MIKLFIIVTVGFIFTSCINTVPKKHKKKEVQTISITISGRGQEIVVNEINDTIIPDSLMAEIYLIELNDNGKIKASVGNGEIYWLEDAHIKDLKMNELVKTDSSHIGGTDLKSIFSLAEEIYQNNEYTSDKPTTDSWFIKLTINDKTNIYYSGECVGKPFGTLDEKYLFIIDKIVAHSPINVREYR